MVNVRSREAGVALAWWIDVRIIFIITMIMLRLFGFPLTPALLSTIAALPQLEILEFIKSNFVEDKWDAK
ncbi:hypothetical protein H5410_019740 [Solanum commersonii]|uniref:Uncharacterized protein n=1 Tax=Solanum commersonii TaxID=4109 RepID=A0A9J5Z631_SOLCO|nr:hypothetical protein H5410_019740 [Solanum commersonii]